MDTLLTFVNKNKLLIPKTKNTFVKKIAFCFDDLKKVINFKLEYMPEFDIINNEIEYWDEDEQKFKYVKNPTEYHMQLIYPVKVTDNNIKYLFSYIFVDDFENKYICMNYEFCKTNYGDTSCVLNISRDYLDSLTKDIIRYYENKLRFINEENCENEENIKLRIRYECMIRGLKRKMYANDVYYSI